MALTMFLVVGDVGPSQAATPSGPATGPTASPRANEDQLFKGNSVVLRIQKALAKEGRYNGRLDGQINNELRAAIRVYQKRNRLKVDGKATKALADRMENQDKVQALLGKLEQARQADLEKARLALLSNPRTKHLVGKPGSERADPTRDVAACFSAPTPACLLKEAAESTKAIAKNDRRDWALGEILVAQSKAGLLKEAMTTLERISDLRLVVVALRNIAIAQANVGRQKEAQDAVEIIPDPAERLEALVQITEIELKRFESGMGLLDKVNSAVGKVLSEVKGRNDLDSISALARVVVVLAESKQTAEIGKPLNALENKVETFLPLEKRGEAYRHLATVYASLGNSDKALESLKLHSSEGDPTPILLAAANAQLREGKAKEALNTAFGITADRYLSVLLTRIATTQFNQGHEMEAKGTLARAKRVSLEISLPYAQSFALSKVALAWDRMGETETAVKTAQEISDERTKAQTLWSISGSKNVQESKKRLDQIAWDASNDIKSTFARSWIFADAAATTARSGADEKAREAFMAGLSIADTITNPWGRARILAKYATVLVDME